MAVRASAICAACSGCASIDLLYITHPTSLSITNSTLRIGIPITTINHALLMSFMIYYDFSYFHIASQILTKQDQSSTHKRGKGSINDSNRNSAFWQQCLGDNKSIAFLDMQAAYLRTEADAPRGTDKHCHDCQRKFSIGVRQHQCKRCLKPVCSDCGNFRREVFSNSSLQLKQHRVCKNCHQASSCIADSIKNQDLRFGETRDSGRRWLKRMTTKPSTFGTDSSQHSVFTREAFASLWGSYSCELRELVGLLTFRYKQEGVFEPVYSVYATVVSAAPQFSFSQVIHLVVYVLCFCSEDKAALIVLFLLELKQAEKDFRAMAFNYLRALPFKNELQKLEGYINYRLERYADSFFVNCMTLECSKALISKTFQKKSIEESLIFFATHIYLNREMLVARSNESKGNLDAIMLRNCKLEQLTSCYKYFKGKNFATDLREPALEDLDHLSLRKMKTMNFQASYSPKEYGNDRNRMRLVSQEIQENKESMDDSLSFYLEPEKENTLKKTQSEVARPHSDIFESSPQLIVHPPFNQDSPFRKSAPQEPLPSELLFPSFLQTSPVRKNTEEVQNDRSKTMKSCENCSGLQERLDELSGRYNEQRRRWQEEKQSTQQASFIEQFAKKSRISQLQKLNIQNQLQIKQFQERVDQLMQQRMKTQEALERAKTESKELNERLMGETNESIKLSAVIQKERKNVRQAREMCLDANRITEGLKAKISELESVLSEQTKREANWKQINSAQEATIRECKSKMAQLQEKSVSLAQQNSSNSRLDFIMTEMKLKNGELEKTIINKERLQQELNATLVRKQEIINGLNDQLKAFKREKYALQQEIRVLKISSQARQAQMISLKAYFSKDSSQQLKAHQQQASQYSLKISNLGKQLMSKQQQLQSLKKSSKLLDTNFIKLNARLSSKEEAINELNEQLKMSNMESQRFQQEIRVLKISSQQLKVYQQKTSQSSIQINDLMNSLTSKQQQLQSLKKSNNFLNMNILELKIEVKRLKEEALRIKAEKQTDQTRSKQTITQLQQNLAVFAVQIENLKKERQRIEEPTFILPPQRTSEKSEEQRSSCESLTARESEISMLTELSERQAKAIEELSREVREMETNKSILTEQMASSSQVLKMSQKTIGELQGQVTILRQRNERMMENIDKLAQEANTLRNQLTIVRSEVESRKNAEIHKLQQSLAATESKHQQLFSKFSKISDLMMEIEEEKIELADELFMIHELLKKRGIPIPK